MGSTMNVRGELCQIFGPQGLGKDHYESLVRLFKAHENIMKPQQNGPGASARDIRAMEAHIYNLERVADERCAELVDRSQHIDRLKALLAERDAVIAKQDRNNQELRAELRTSREELDYEHKRHEAEVEALRKRFGERRKSAGQREDRNSGRLFEQEKKIKFMQQKINGLEEVQEEQDTALILATAFQKEAHERREQLVRALDKRREQNFALQEQISGLQNQIFRLTHATSWDEATGVALETQAAAHLILVQRLQADLAESEAKAEALLAAKLVLERDANEQHKVRTEDYATLTEELEVAQSQQTNAQKALSDANGRAEKWKAMADEQATLIEKLMAAE